MGKPTPIDVDEIWERMLPLVNKGAPDGCWQWTGQTDRGGYGKYVWQPDTYITHRIAYQALVGDIPEHLEIDHLCRNRACCNPEHLEPVAHLENVRRGVNAWESGSRVLADVCKNGHERTEGNTYRRADGARVCRPCKRMWAKQARARA